MSQKPKQSAIPSPRSAGRGSAFLVAAGLLFAAGVGFAVGYTVGKKTGLQPLQLVASRDKPQPPPPSPPPRREPEDPLKAPKVDVPIAPHSPTRGPATAPVTIVEFSEFQ